MAYLAVIQARKTCRIYGHVLSTSGLGPSPRDQAQHDTLRYHSPACHKQRYTLERHIRAHVQPSNALGTFYSTSGRVSDSVDGLGTLSDTGTIRVNKPVGATVRAAFLLAASTGYSGYQIPNGDVQIDGTPVNWTTTIPSSISSYNSRADVTSIVQSKIDAAPPGLIYFTIAELHTTLVDGEILHWWMARYCTGGWRDTALVDGEILHWWMARYCTGGWRDTGRGLQRPQSAAQ